MLTFCNNYFSEHLWEAAFYTVASMSEFYETALIIQKKFFTFQNTSKIIENNSRERCEIYSKLTIKTAEWRIRPHCCAYLFKLWKGIVDFEKVVKN